MYLIILNLLNFEFILSKNIKLIRRFLFLSYLRLKFLNILNFQIILNMKFIKLILLL
jgi:hypothetical protein